MSFSPTHPTDSYRPREHLDTHQFRARLDRALRAYYPESESNIPHYDSVSVLLLLWDNDHLDLKCRGEVERLERTFQLSYGYSTKIAEIPAWSNVSPEQWLFTTFVNLIQGKTARDLLIIYYAGHGDSTPNEPCIWLSGRERFPSGGTKQASLNFSAPRTSICSSSADVLFLLDACHSAGAAIGGPRKELIAASAVGVSAKGPGYHSFTTVLNQELVHAASSGEFITASMLFAKLLNNTHNGSLKYCPVHAEMSPEARLSIFLLPLQNVRSPGPSPATWPNCIPTSVVLTVQLRDGTSNTLDQLQTWLTNTKPPGVECVKLRTIWRSTSCTLVFELPVEAWYCLAGHPAIWFLSYRLPPPATPTTTPRKGDGRETSTSGSGKGKHTPRQSLSIPGKENPPFS